MKPPRKLAVFDIDGTIFRSSLLIEVTEALIQEKIFPRKVKDIYETSYQRWLSREGSYKEYIDDVVRAFELHIRRVSRKDFLAVAKKVVAFHGSRVYVFTRDLVRDLQKKQYYILAISHSPKELVNEFCRTMGFDKVYGRVYEVGSNGKFTGVTLYADLINDKEKIFRRAMEKGGFTLKGSVGVGDSESDIAFLKLVDRPICFNPNKKLYLHAKMHDWEVRVERKDVVYHV